MGTVSLGIGLTNACNLDCAHCYRPKGEIHHLGTDDVAAMVDHLDVHSVNLGTGENILNPHLPAVLGLLRERGIRTSLTSNGLSLRELAPELLADLHDVEVSFDFATRRELDAFRGDGVWDSAVAAVERCVGMGLDVTVLAVMMRSNHDRLADVARLARRLGARFRVNVYQPVHGALDLMPTWQELWSGFARLLAETALVTCTEPVVAAVVARELGEPHANPAAEPRGCGHTSVRLTPRGDVLPCVYWPRAAGTLGDLQRDGADSIVGSAEFVRSRLVPDACAACPLLPRCGGGCASRRALTVGVEEPDPYCPFRFGGDVSLAVTPGAAAELLHAANVCTTIVEAPR